MLAKICVRIGVAVCIIGYVDVVSVTKGWTEAWEPSNGVSARVSCLALERSESFMIAERKYERFRGCTIFTAML